MNARFDSVKTSTFDLFRRRYPHYASATSTSFLEKFRVLFEIHVVDPFDLAKRTVAEALAAQAVVLAGNAELEGRPCYRIESWEVSQNNFVYATKTQWWIDEESFLLKQIV